MIKAVKIIGVELVLIMLFATCRKGEEPTYQLAREAQTFTNVAYGSDPKQIMDVYLPPNRTSNTNVIIFIHGGSFIGGDKSEFDVHAKYLALNGYAVLNINYRLVSAAGLFEPVPQHLVSAVKIKDQVNDISSAVDFAIANAKTWVMSSTRIGIAGHSSGATLALLYSYDQRNARKVQAVANIAGALDMVLTDVPNWQFYPPYVLEGGYRYTGVTVKSTNEPAFKAISPIYVANKTRLIPTLTIFPEDNEVLGLPKMDILTYNSFTAKLDELNIPNKFIYMTGSDHNFSQKGDWQTVIDNTVDYFNRNIK